MRYFTLFTLYFITSCSGNNTTDQLTNDRTDSTSITNDTLNKVELKAVEEFLNLNESFFSELGSYDKTAIEDLLLNDVKEEFGWSDYFISEDELFISLSNNDFFETIEFRILNRNNKEVAFLSLQTKLTSSCIYLEKDQSGSWTKGEDIPLPHLADFFEDVTDEEIGLIEEYGVYGVHLDNNSDTVTYIFYDFQFAQSLPFEHQQTFTKEAKYDFILKWDNSEFRLERIGYNQ